MKGKVRTLTFVLALLTTAAPVSPALAQNPVAVWRGFEQTSRALRGLRGRPPSGALLVDQLKAAGVNVQSKPIRSFALAYQLGEDVELVQAVNANAYVRAAVNELLVGGSIVRTPRIAGTCLGPACDLSALSASIDAAATRTATRASAEPDYYDEIFFPDGSIRPWYADAYVRYMGMSENAKLQFMRQTRKDFSGDYPIAPLPRILLQSEFDFVQAGVKQRARAFQAFLRDHYGGRQTYRDVIIPGREVDQMIARSGEVDMQQYITREAANAFRFIYGPDMIRDANGVWRVLEDNHGFVGGIGDLVRAQEIFAARMPELAAITPTANQPIEFFEALAARAGELANPPLGPLAGDGKFVVYSMPPYADKEDLRIHRLLESVGAIVVTPNTKWKLVVRRSGAFVERELPSGAIQRRKVGYLFLNAEHRFFEWSHPAIREQALVAHARDHLAENRLRVTVRRGLEDALKPDPVTGRPDIEKIDEILRTRSNYINEVSPNRGSPVPGLFQAILDGRVQTNFTPGIEFLGDKMLNTYVEDMIRYYLGEEPLLRNVPTIRFTKMGAAGEIETDLDAIAQVMDNKNRYVVKVVDGRGGDEVWVGPSTPAREWRTIRAKLVSHPDRYLAQEFTHLSVVGDRIVDLRVISQVDETGNYVVANTPFGRSIPLGANGKVNLSKQGTETVVIVVPDPPR